MRIRSVLFGFGAGLIILSFVFLLLYRRELQQAEVSEYLPAPTPTDEAVIARAVVLGMVWPEEDNVTLSETEIIRKAFELGMTFEVPVPTLAVASKTEINGTDELSPPVSTPLPETELTPTPTTKVMDEPTPTLAPEVTPTSRPTPTPRSGVVTPAAAVESVGEDGKTYVTLTIQHGSNASVVAAQFYQAGLVSDAKTFSEYLVNQNRSRHVLSGTFTLPKGASYEELMLLITIRS